MTLNHIHLQVCDLKGAIDWFERILQIHPGFQNERMATFAFNAFTIIVDASSDDAPATMGFESDDCDRDFRAVVERGAIALEPPTNQEWGVRAAYFRGPGALRFEIEGPSANR
jgi:catechol 2,3-dioxygenase-like lactoylglutathione lyase family enzyme